jgi:hypothetical protein
MMKRFLLGLGALLAFAVGGAALAQSVGDAVFGSLRLDTGTKTATATAGAATLSKTSGKVTSEALTTAAAATYTLTITNTRVVAVDQAFVSVANVTNSAGSPQVQSVTPGAGSLVVVIRNAHATEAFNGTLRISFFVLKN